MVTALAMIGNEKVCPVCGKQYITYAEWAYKRSFSGRMKEFCSWSCLRKYEKNHLGPAERRDMMIDMLLEGKDIKFIADTLDCEPKSVYYWKNKLVKEGSL